MCCLLWTAQLCAQYDPKTDSLRQLLEHQPPDTHRVALLNQIGGRLANQDYNEALKVYDEALALADSLQDVRGLADAKSGYAELQNSLGVYEKSMESALEAYEIYRILKDSLGMGRASISIGLVQIHLKQYDKAVQSLRQAEEAYATAKSLRGRLTALHNIAVVYEQTGDTLAAKRQYMENLHMLEGTEHWIIFAATYNNLGLLFNAKMESDSALQYFEKALKYKRMRPNPASIGNTLINIAEVYMAIGDLIMAEAKLSEAKPLILDSGVKDRIVQFHETAGSLFYQMGRYKEAAEHFQQQARVQDSIYEPQMAEKATRLEAAYRAENQRKEIELLNRTAALDAAEKTRWRWITVAISIVLMLCIALLLLAVVRGRERTRMMKLLQQKNAEIKRQQQEIVLQNEALSLQNKRLADLNHEKDGLIGVVAHDIRAPLNRSGALAELISNLGNLSPEQERYLQMIKKVTEDGGQLIQDLLELNSYESSSGMVNLAEVDLADLMDHSIHGFKKAAEQKGIQLHWEGTKAMARTDEKLLGRILDNLISNAIKFTPRGKQVFLSVEENGSLYWLKVRDEGPGISVEDQKKMFQKFQRLSARPTGGESSTGLGLSIVKTLASRIQAEVVFESELGKGTTFQVGIRKTS